MPSFDPAAVTHRLVDVRGGQLHLVEQGSGPVVLLVHGFPESWYSWRHQLPALAVAGYRAVAIDVRGYGDSLTPTDVQAYRMLAHVADNVDVLRALDVESAVIVGHDWGSPIAANSALLRPDLFSAVALLSVPYLPRGGPRPTEIFAHMGGENEVYISYFQAPGRAEAEIEPDIRGWLRGVYAGISADTMPGGSAAEAGALFFIAPGGRMSDRFVPDVRPAWLNAEDLDFYADQFTRSGFTGPLGRYRNVDTDWDDLAAWDGAPLRQPSLFLGGALDPTTHWNAAAIEQFPRTLPGLRGSHLLDNCGHWIQQEQPALVNRYLLEWLADV